MGIIVATVVLAVFAANAFAALKIRRILAWFAGFDDVAIARRGAVWRYQVSSAAVLATGAVIYLIVLVRLLT